MQDVALRCEKVSKKFCKGLKKSMLYGVTDILQSSVGILPDSSVLRADEFWALENVNFELKKGETFGIVGPNGSGKTTLLKMLNGIFMPDRGQISIHGKVGALIQVGAGFHPMLSGRENIYINGAILGMSKKEIDKKFDAIVDFADIGDFLDAPVKHYSSGMFVRLGFSIAVHCEPDILLIDEILSVGDISFQSKCNKFMTEKLLKTGCTVIFVSHNRYAVQDLCQKALYLKKGQQAYIGETNQVMDFYLKDIGKSDRKESVLNNGLNITQIEWLDENGTPKTQFQSGEKAIVRFHYDFDRKILCPSVGITLVHADKRYNVVSNTDYLFNVHSGYDGFEVPSLEGKGYFEVTIDQFYAPIGVYRCLTYLFEENNLKLIEKNEHAGDIEIVWSPSSAKRSLLDLPHHWNLKHSQK
jgi:ABC-type polysaccharide/polyol phosphate transport system ATPase subunit